MLTNNFRNLRMLQKYSLCEVVNALAYTVNALNDGDQNHDTNTIDVSDEPSNDVAAQRKYGVLTRLDVKKNDNFITLLSGPRGLFALTDIRAVELVLNDIDTFGRSEALEEFAMVFNLESVFTTKNEDLGGKLRCFFAKNTNNLSEADWTKNLSSLNNKAEAAVLSLLGDQPEKFIQKIEAATFDAYAESFFGMPEFPDSESCTALIKEIWRIKSLRNNIPWCRFNPLLFLRLRYLQNNLFEIVKSATMEVSYSRSSTAQDMASTYIEHSLKPGNLLNAMIPLYEAVSRGVICGLIALAGDTKIQDDLRQEIANNEGSCEAYLRSEDTLLHRVWLETLRLWPPTPNQTRRVLKSNSLGLKENSKVVVVWGLFHLASEVWGTDFYAFKPERWRTITLEQRANYNPFGLGPQKCVARDYGSFGGKALIRSIVKARRLELPKGPSYQSSFSIDRGYSRGPDPNTTKLIFNKLTIS